VRIGEHVLQHLVRVMIGIFPQYLTLIILLVIIVLTFVNTTSALFSFIWSRFTGMMIV